MAWKIKHKLMQVMMERDAAKRLTGRIEVDDTYLGGERNGGKRGRGSPAKTPIVAAVETTPQGKPIRLKLRRVKGFRRAEMTALATRNFNPASPRSSGSTRPWETSKAPSPVLIVRSETSMCPATSPNSNTGSTAATISPP